MSDLKVLWLARDIPLPLNSGDKLYTAYLADALARAGAHVTFMAMPSEEAPGIDPATFSSAIEWNLIDAAPRGKLASVLSARPLVTARYAVKGAAEALRRQLFRFHYDVLMLDQYAMGWVLGALTPAQRRRLVLAHLAHDFETEVTAAIARDYRGNPATKAFLHLNALKTGYMERRLARECDLLAVITPEDRAHFEALGTRRRPIVVRPGYSGTRVAERTITADQPRKVVILGSFAWIAKQMNLTAFLSVADAIFAERGVALDIIGTMPAELRTEWEGRLKATRFLGFVDNVAPHLAEARMGLVIEATGGGFKLKTLDYIFSRLPVAALAPALGGVEPLLRERFIVADEGASLARAVCDAIDDIDRLNAMQNGAFTAAASEFDWSVNGQRLLAALLECRPHAQGSDQRAAALAMNARAV